MVAGSNPAIDDALVADNGTDVERRGNLRSTIAFPYTSLKDAEQIANELHDKWGGSASQDQLAGGLGTGHRSGAFRIKLSTARTFGVVEVIRGRVSLTPLGRRLVDPQTRLAARVEAFFRVPLFKALFEDYKGSALPPDPGLERKIDELGVSAKQTMKARQAFQRSAELAGFFAHGRERLVEPPTMPNSGDSSNADSEKDERDVTLDAGITSTLPAPLPDLWRMLLQDGRSWSAEKTQEFVQAARKLHDLLDKTG